MTPAASMHLQPSALTETFCFGLIPQHSVFFELQSGIDVMSAHVNAARLDSPQSQLEVPVIFCGLMAQQACICAVVQPRLHAVSMSLCVAAARQARKTNDVDAMRAPAIGVPRLAAMVLED